MLDASHHSPSQKIVLMYSDSAGKSLDLSATQILARRAEKLARRRIWLPKLIYDALPWFYLAAGCSAFFATLYISDWFWVLPHYLLFSAGCLHLSFAVYRRRRRAARKRTDAEDRRE
jgi:hypothetical protein